MRDQDGASLIEVAGGFGGTLTRRDWLLRSSAAVAALGGVARSEGTAARAADNPGLIIRSRRPLDLETPPHLLDTWLTPASRLFIRSHFGSPSVEGPPWTLEISGKVDRPVRLDLDTLAKGEQVTLPAVIQCAGNGRAFFRPVVPGLAWERGAVGQAEWTGVRLAEVLERAGVKPDAAHVHFLGSDGPPSPKTPPFLRSIPLSKAMDPSTILATAMNGEPLPVLHGGPVRLVVPGWTANHWMKWVRWINVSEEEAPGLYQRSAYKMPKTPAPPDAVLGPDDLVSVTAMNVKSLITGPAEGANVPPGRVEVSGVAWTGPGNVTRVDVAAGAGGDWRPAELIDPVSPFGWRRWRIAFDSVAAGPATFRSRATDSHGEVQPETTPWNRSGYLWNAIDQVTIKVG